MNIYNYAILKENNPDFAKETTIKSNNWQSVSYALFIKQVDVSSGTEVILKIIYSDNLKQLSCRAEDCVSWYNYVTGRKMDIQGNISDI